MDIPDIKMNAMKASAQVKSPHCSELYQNPTAIGPVKYMSILKAVPKSYKSLW
jgi:hypothetical protein